ncbi:MAG: NAD-dependent epimerase/dehydratase family protein [Candidatus Aquirickettsiella sp.]
MLEKRLLVTGAAGFIGRTLVKQLAESGYWVDALDSFRFSNRNQIYAHKNIQWVEGDTRNWKLISELSKGKQAIIHLAAPSSFLMHEENDLEACEFTLMGFKTVMEAAKKHAIKKVVWASTSAVYEGNQVPYHESMLLNPPDSKAGCKLFCEQEARRYSERYGITCIGLRPFSVYGVGEHTKGGYANIVSLFTWAIMHGEEPVVWGDGSQTRDFIFVEDAATFFQKALESNISTQELNVGFGKEYSFNEVIQHIAQILGKKVKPRYVPIPIKIYAHRLWADMRKTESVLNLKPHIDLSQGIKKIIEATAALNNDLLRDKQHYYLSLNEVI